MTHPRVILVLLCCAACGADTPPEAAPAPAPVEAPAPVAGEVLASGTVAIPEGASTAGAVVFVSLRAAGVRGPPLAAKQLPAGPFPLAFSITSDDRPMNNGPIPDTFELKVKLDGDGDAMSTTDGDLVVVQQTTRGATDLNLVLAPQ